MKKPFSPRLRARPEKTEAPYPSASTPKVMLNTLELSSIRSRKAPQEIVYQVRRQILAGLLERGSKLPSEQELMRTFHMSRQTLREALRVLEVQGLLEIRAGSGGGAFVAEVDLETAQTGLINFFHGKNLSLPHLTATRAVVEPYLAEQAALNRTDEDIEFLEAIHRNCHEAVRNRQPNEARSVMREHVRTVGAFLEQLADAPLEWR